MDVCFNLIYATTPVDYITTPFSLGLIRTTRLSKLERPIPYWQLNLKALEKYLEDAYRPAPIA